MFKNIMHIYWMKLSMFPVFVNNAFYYFIKVKLAYAFLNFLGAIFSLLNLLTFPIAVIINLSNLLWKKISSKEKYNEIKINLYQYYSNSRREIIRNKRQINIIINDCY